MNSLKHAASAHFFIIKVSLTHEGGSGSGGSGSGVEDDDNDDNNNGNN